MNLEFEAWHEASKTMFKWKDLTISGEFANVAHRTEGLFTTDKDDIDRVILRLASPLKDIKGVWIRHGDLLQRYKKSGLPYKSLKEVRFNGKNFYGLDAAYECEIVGNIFQNPDLLKTKP